MISEQQVLNITAFLELARTAIDDAELKLVALLSSKMPGTLLLKIRAQINAAVDTLHVSEDWVKQYEHESSKVSKDAAPADGITAGRTVPAEQKTGSDSIS